jgi:hypothetical protein
MPRKLTLFAACALALIACASARAQDSTTPSSSPSLGDLARQAQKDKDKNRVNKPVAKVLTDDDVSAGSTGGSSSLAEALGTAAQPGPAGKSAEVQSPAEGLEKIQSMLDGLSSLDRAALANNVLDGNTSNFAGRADWEAKMFAAKQAFVAENRTVLEKMRQLQASSAELKDVQDPNDPRLKSISAKLQELVQASQQYGAAFQAVVTEGKDLAAQSAVH